MKSSPCTKGPRASVIEAVELGLTIRIFFCCLMVKNMNSSPVHGPARETWVNRAWVGVEDYRPPCRTTLLPAKTDREPITRLPRCSPAPQFCRGCVKQPLQVNQCQLKFSLLALTGHLSFLAWRLSPQSAYRPCPCGVVGVIQTTRTALVTNN